MWKIAEGQNFVGEAVREEHQTHVKMRGKFWPEAIAPHLSKVSTRQRQAGGWCSGFQGQRDGFGCFGGMAMKRVPHPNERETLTSFGLSPYAV